MNIIKITSEESIKRLNKLAENYGVVFELEDLNISLPEEIEIKVYSIAEAAKILKVSQALMYKMVSEKQIDHRKLNGKILFDHQTISEVGKIRAEGKYIPKINYTVSEARKILNVSQSFLYRMVEDNQVVCKKIGKKILFTMEDLEDAGKLRAEKGLKK